MKRHPESPFYSPNFLKKGSLSQNPYTPSSQSPAPNYQSLQRNSSTIIANSPPPQLNLAESQASTTPRDTIFSFRTPRIETPDQRSSTPLPLTIVASPKDQYETVYKADFGTSYSSPKVVQAFSPSRALSQDLSPLADDLAPKKRLRKRGEYSPNREFKAHPKEATFVERIGERHQPPRPDSRAHIEAPRSRSNYRLVATHFYKPLEPDHGENAASYSPSRLAKSVLDYYPPHSGASREGSASRNVESLAYDRDFSPDEAKITSKVGRHFSSVTNRIRTAGSGSPQRRPCSTEPADYTPIATVLANSYGGGEDERISPTLKYSSVEKGIGSNAPKIKRYQSSGRLHGRRESPAPVKEGESKANLTRNPTPQVPSGGHRRNVSSVTVVSVNARQAQPEQSQVNENRQKIQERRKGRAGAGAQSENKTGSVSVNKTSNSFSTLKVITVSVDKARPASSMSVKSLRPPVIVPRRIAGAERSSEKNLNATMVVSHEKKKPIRGGTFGSPMIKKGLASNMEKSKLGNIKSTINIKWK